MYAECLLPLELLQTGEWADVAEINGDPCWVNRMAELGLRAGSRLQVVQDGSPCMLNIEGCKLCLRGDACSRILVRPISSPHGN
ncbi:MAG: ferrous iron transport protein A [Planctomycetes bacterium]|nr:ferrous iron transport protein A [Planctomycetota bacterium]